MIDIQITLADGHTIMASEELMPESWKWAYDNRPEELLWRFITRLSNHHPNDLRIATEGLADEQEKVVLFLGKRVMTFGDHECTIDGIHYKVMAIEDAEPAQELTQRECLMEIIYKYKHCYVSEAETLRNIEKVFNGAEVNNKYRYEGYREGHFIAQNIQNIFSHV